MKYFSRISLTASAANVQQIAELFCQDSYRDHQLIWFFFPGASNTTRNFLYRREQTRGSLKFYVVSEDIPQDKDGLWRIDHQRYEPKLSTGARLQFSSRVNPVITRVNEQGRRHDVVMDLKKRCGYADLTQFDRPLLAELVQEAGVKWLVQRAKKLGFSFSPDEVRVDGYRQHTLFSRGRKIRFSTLDFNGVLQVTEPDIFIQKALFQGLGPAKAFGCGLMLVKRV